MAPLDLTEEPLPLFSLLDDAAAWRLRLVERIEIVAATRYRVTSRYHCQLPQGFATSAPGETKVRLVLPIATRVKQPLLNFSATGPDGSPSHLVPRSRSANLQAEYLLSLAKRTPLGRLIGPDREISDDLLRAVCFFSPAVWWEFPTKRPSREIALAHYLEGGIGLRAGPQRVAKWLDRCDAVAIQLGEVLGEEPNTMSSSSDCVLLALPHLDEHPTSLRAVDTLVDRFADAVDNLYEASASDDAALDFLLVLGDYGRRWEMMLELEMPLDAPATVVVADDRLFTIVDRCRVQHRIALGEAPSVHVEAVIPDHTLEFTDLRLIDVETKEEVGIGPVDDRGGGIGPLELLQKLGDTLAIYSSTESKPYYADLHMTLRPTFDVRWPPRVAFAVTLGALAVASIVDNDDLVDTLAVLVVPTTFAATFTLIREQSTLAMALQRRVNVALGIAIVALWVVAASRLLGAGLDLGWLPLID
ncbi:MAG TPA: hypothetical protein VHF51_11090 [Solirubrobacteraceae bacterium]|nr:hypothetical protein [Solirubrobacteraceae bacterium]